MIAKYNRISLLLGIPGILLQIAGNVMTRSMAEGGSPMALLGLPLMLLGTVMLMVGLAFYAKAKGRHPAWCLMGLLSLVGLIVLGCLKDKSNAPSAEVDGQPPRDAR